VWNLTYCTGPGTYCTVQDQELQNEVELYLREITEMLFGVGHSDWLRASKPAEERDRSCRMQRFSDMENRGVVVSALKSSSRILPGAGSTLLSPVALLWPYPGSGAPCATAQAMSFKLSQQVRALSEEAFSPCRSFSCWSGRTEL